MLLGCFHSTSQIQIDARLDRRRSTSPYMGEKRLCYGCYSMAYNPSSILGGSNKKENTKHTLYKLFLSSFFFSFAICSFIELPNFPRWRLISGKVLSGYTIGFDFPGESNKTLYLASCTCLFDDILNRLFQFALSSNFLIELFRYKIRDEIQL